MVPLDIFADPICPWCYLGKTLFDRALAERPDHPFAIEWQPFRLDPDTPPEGRDHRAWLEAKLGRDGAAAAEAHVAATARSYGIDLDPTRVRRTPPTLDAHRLIHWAGIEGRQDAVVAALFAAHFDDGRDISEIETLADIADTAGLDAAVVAKLLRSDVDKDVILAREAAARKMGLTGVPTFIVNRRHAVPGLQPTELWLRVIDEVAGSAAATGR